MQSGTSQCPLYISIYSITYYVYFMYTLFVNDIFILIKCTRQVDTCCKWLFRGLKTTVFSFEYSMHIKWKYSSYLRYSYSCNSVSIQLFCMTVSFLYDGTRDFLFSEECIFAVYILQNNGIKSNDEIPKDSRC